MTVDGEEVAGSPFPVFVSIHPKKLGKPVRVITGLREPTGVVVNSSGEIIISELNGEVVAKDKKGKTLRSLKRSEHNLRLPRGVAMDSDDNIYYVDQDVNVILKCDKRMEGELARIETEKTMLLGHECVACVGNEIMACDLMNEGGIKVYSKELERVRNVQLSTSILPTLSSISPDRQGNLHACDSKNGQVLVVGGNGDVLPRYSAHTLDSPFGIHVTDQYVYVTDRHSDTVLVFTTERKFVTSFGQRGCKEGDLNYPIGVCVDRDGFVYVCDHFNKRVQIF